MEKEEKIYESWKILLLLLLPTIESFQLLSSPSLLLSSRGVITKEEEDEEEEVQKLGDQKTKDEVDEEQEDTYVKRRKDTLHGTVVKQIYTDENDDDASKALFIFSSSH